MKDVLERMLQGAFLQVLGNWEKLVVGGQCVKLTLICFLGGNTKCDIGLHSLNSCLFLWNVQLE